MSRTAMLVAALRHAARHDPALHAVCDDPVAPLLLPWPVARMAAADGILAQALQRPARALIEHLALRTALIDEALRAALGEGIEQVVLLGAGLDGRAHRIGALATAHVIELDRPAMLRRKQRRLRGRPAFARRLSYAPTDFAEGGLAAALASAGHVAERPSFWIWEGVTMYLPPAAMEATMAVLAERSASGSGVAVTYATPELAARSALLGQLGALGLAALAEPIRCTSTPQEMAARWRRQGFAVLRDELPTAAGARFGIGLAPQPRLFAPDERVLVARRD